MRVGASVAAAAILFSAQFAHAGLGGSLSSIQQDAHNLGVPSTIMHQSHYDRYEIKMHRLRLHEFLAPNGNVFALAWRGTTHPDLRKLLGPYFQDVVKAFTEARREHRHAGSIVADFGNVHVEIGGRMRSAYGMVWLKDQLPSGMDLHEIQ